MIQSGHRAGFFFETMAARRLMRDVGRQHLHGDIAVETSIAGAVNLAHPSGANRSDDLVRTQAGGTGERHVIESSLATRVEKVEKSNGITRDSLRSVYQFPATAWFVPDTDIGGKWGLGSR
jgi:hypothetical protein